MAGPAHHEQARLLWTTLYQLKSVKRTGWLDRGIPAADTESVADHSFFMMLIASVVAGNDRTIDATKVLQLALVHDLAEAIAGDIPPYDPEDIPENEEARRAFFAVRRVGSPENRARKQAIEAAAAEQILAMLPPSIHDSWEDLLHEYEERITPEAQLVKEIDRLEVFIQSRLYAGQFPDVPVDGFADMARETITHPLLIEIRDAFLETLS